MRRLLVAALAGSALAAAAAGAVPQSSPQSRAPHDPGWDHYLPQWSPDGSRILYEREYRPPKASPAIMLAVVPSGGGGLRRLVDQPEEPQWDTYPRWSPDGRRIVFQRANAGSTAVIMVADASGHGVRPLTTPAPSGGAPAWSPDGALVAFGGGSGFLYVARADGTGLRRLTSGGEPVWSPDGRSIAFDRRTADGRGSAVYVLGLGGSGVHRLTDDDSLNAAYGWSADGRTLLYESNLGTDSPSIWTMAADGSDKRRLGSGRHASFSPDGTRITFDRGGDVLVMRSDGEDVQTVFRNGVYPSWSPDGKLLALSAQGPCLGWGIYVVRAAGGGARRVTNDCRVVGTAGPDVLDGTRERDLVRGLGGDDLIRTNPTDRGPVYFGRANDDFADGGPGNDRVWGGRGSDVLLGGAGNDVLHGGRLADRLDGGPGDDVLDGGRFRDRLLGGPGDDLVLARDGFRRDRISCGPGRDRVVADRGDLVAADCESVAFP